MNDLLDLKNDVNRQLESAEEDGKLPTTQVKNWLRDVEESWCPSWRPTTSTTTTEDFVSVWKCQDCLKSTYAACTFEYVPGRPSIGDQPTASRTLDEMMRVLDDEKNLNNKLKSNIVALKQPFSIVIWATVSMGLDIKRVKRRKLEAKFQNDVWENIDLDCLGVPQPKAHNGPKRLLTSRFSDVCRQTMTDFELKVNTLIDEEAWKLFSKKAGYVASLKHITPFAEEVTRECCGLALANIQIQYAEC
ncbi:NB-ARC domain containing protein [Trema orientale]|uniref:NB-ARC domain containing protein n=1 Tax=Trema orientale TaxID=63057 RepID=A0A2P5C4G8_TREOI|nr:NB-ARC domain containing protein [Trema orientale]